MDGADIPISAQSISWSELLRQGKTGLARSECLVRPSCQPVVKLTFVRNNRDHLSFFPSASSNIPRTMKKRKPIFSRFFRKGQPETPYNPTGSDRPERTSSGPTPLHPRPQPGTEHSGPSSEDPPPVSFPDGVEVLHDCPNATVDICFVHGLTGNRDSAWTAHRQSTPWPKTLLPPKLTRARILTYGYDAYIVRKSGASSNRLIDHATNLLNDLTTDRTSRDASSRPLIFVTHSLGGLVCKEAILLSRNNPEPHLRGIFDCTKGIVFMGTPHKGSWMADWAKIPASALGLVKSTNKLLLEILETDDQFLESIQVRFWSMIRCRLRCLWTKFLARTREMPAS